MERIQWVDGLRGLAVFLIAFNHYFNGEITTPYRSFWAEPAEKNRHLIQLLPFRLLWQFHAMVSLLMVISGYSVSLNLLRVRDSGSLVQFIANIRSAVCRRPFRLYLPAFLFAFFSQVLFFFDFYPHWYRDGKLAAIEPRTSPFSHVQYLCEYVIDSLNLLKSQYNHGLNQQFWMMPHELRGSLIIFFTIFTQSTWRQKARLWSLLSMYIYFFWFGHWDVCNFISGLLIAEMRVPPSRNSVARDRRSSLQTCGYAICFAAGMYLLGLPDGYDFPPDYKFLSRFLPYHWIDYQHWSHLKSPWYSLGSTMLLYSISGLEYFQRLLNARPCQYLGKLSFALYATHMLVFLMWRQQLRDYIWIALTDEIYPGAEVASHKYGAFQGSFVISGLILTPVVFLAAEMYDRVVEPRLARLTRTIDERLNNSGQHFSDTVSGKETKPS